MSTIGTGQGIGNAAPPLAGRLRDRLLGILSSRGQSATPEVVRLVVDFSHALLRADANLAGLDAERLDKLAQRLAARSNLAPAAVAQMVRVAMAPEYRIAHDQAELAAFSARHGAEAAVALADEDQEAVDLQGFARRHGSADALLLLDALVELYALGQGISPQDLTRLEAASDALGVDGVLFGNLLRKHDPRHAQGEHSYALTRDEITIGRRSDCTVQLMDPQVAPLHARLVRSTDGWRVVDAGSGRATVVDGEAVASAPFALGDRLRIGPFTLSLAEQGDTLVAESDRAFSALTLRDVQRTITSKGRSKALLSDVGFTAYSGEVIAVVGPSGSGKTTLLHVLGLLADPSSGRYLLDGSDVGALGDLERSRVRGRQIGFVFQSFHLVPQLDVLGNVLLAARYGGVEGDARSRARDLVEHVGLGQRAGHRPTELSGGEMQRVAIARALLTRPKLVLADEPTGNLDDATGDQIFDLLAGLREGGSTVVLVTHDRDLAARTDREVRLKDGFVQEAALA